LAGRGPTRLALLGRGPGPESIRPLIADRPDLELCGELRADAARGRNGSFHRLGELLARGRPELAVVGGPPGSLVDELARLLGAGVDVLVEPPVAADALDADALESLAERLGRTLVTAAPLRHAHALRLARRAVERGLCGPPVALELNLALKDHPEVHALDAAELLAGPIERVRMFGEGELWTEHARGGLRARTLRELDPARPAVRCVGERGSIEVGSTATSLLRDGGRRVLGPGLCPWEARRAVLDDFLARRRDPHPALDHGAQALHWLAAARRSLERGRWEYA
jgi:predicted dehydrogenase